MIKAIIRAMYTAFISILSILIILAGWTFFVFISQPTKSAELTNVMRDIYVSQKSVIINFVDLSKLLLSDNGEKLSSEDDKLLIQSELVKDQEDVSLLDELSMQEVNADNPLGIVIEPSMTEENDENSPDIIFGPLDIDQSSDQMNDIS